MSALVVDHDVYFLDLACDALMAFRPDASDGSRGRGDGPFAMREGMNRLLRTVDIASGRDAETLRPGSIERARYWTGSNARRGSITTKPSPELSVAPPTPPRLDASGIYRQRGRLSYAVIGVYVFLILVLIVIFPLRNTLAYSWAPWAVAALFVLFLARYMSTSYSIDDSYLRAWRILGGRRIALEKVNKIEYDNLATWDRRADSSGPGAGTVGCGAPRSAALTPSIRTPRREFSSRRRGCPSTSPPFDVPEFARELSRRVRSYTGRLLVDVGDPHARVDAPES